MVNFYIKIFKLDLDTIMQRLKGFFLHIELWHSVRIFPHFLIGRGPIVRTPINDMPFIALVLSYVLKGQLG